MEISRRIKNIVLVGKFNPASFDKYFFIKNEILKEEEILTGSIFGALGGMQLVSNKYNIIISINQIIISATNPEKDDDEIEATIISLIKGAKKVNVVALGMNFHWHIEDSEKSMEIISKEFFYNDKLDLFTKFFNSEDALFGAYASINYMDSRLKLDIKPNNIIDNASKKNVMNFAFNFHFDIVNRDDNSELIKYLSDYNAYKEKSEEIISIF